VLILLFTMDRFILSLDAAAGEAVLAGLLSGENGILFHWLVLHLQFLCCSWARRHAC